MIKSSITKPTGAEDVRVLIVNREVEVRETISTLVEVQGWKSQAVARGEEALELVESEYYDLVVLGLMLPGVSGMEVLKQVHQQCPTTVVVVVTAHVSIEGTVEVMRAGAFDLIPKPFKNDDLVLALRQALANGRRIRQDEEIRARIHALTHSRRNISEPS